MGHSKSRPAMRPSSPHYVDLYDARSSPSPTHVAVSKHSNNTQPHVVHQQHCGGRSHHTTTQGQTGHSFHSAGFSIRTRFERFKRCPARTCRCPALSSTRRSLTREKILTFISSSSAAAMEPDPTKPSIASRHPNAQFSLLIPEQTIASISPPTLCACRFSVQSALLQMSG
ncbi:hypothetical protein BC628DRAFT_412956 [Trametes gibbosa]|nr:hypothetical protein BC628DRAFT_412956 [Trametes gibbosa]